METDALSRLKAKLDLMRRERDEVNSEVLHSRAYLAEREAELSRLQADYMRSRTGLQAKEDSLSRLDLTIRETENASGKIYQSIEKLIAAIEQETAHIPSAHNSSVRQDPPHSSSARQDTPHNPTKATKRVKR